MLPSLMYLFCLRLQAYETILLKQLQIRQVETMQYDDIFK